MLASTRIVRYLKGTKNFKLKYHKPNDVIIVAYNDANWGSDSYDRKSTSGYLFHTYIQIVFWYLKGKVLFLHRLALSSSISKVIWLKYLLMDLKKFKDGPIIIFEDNM